jgi:hypothetical protein
VLYYEKTVLGLAMGGGRTMIFLLAIKNGIFHQFLVQTFQKKKGEFIKKYETKYADGGYGNIQETQNKNDTLISNMNVTTVHNLRF